MAKSKEPKTHFEQIPLEIVKTIPSVDIQVGETGQPECPSNLAPDAKTKLPAF